MMFASRWLLITVLLVASSVACAIQPLPFENAAQRQRFQELTSQLRCMVCQNESLADSNAKLAQDLREKVFHMMQQGMSDAEIKDYLVERYSVFVLYKPPLQPRTWLLWFGPAVVLLLGGAGAITWLRRRSSSTAEATVERHDEDWEENW